jgi:hypothetical protein
VLPRADVNLLEETHVERDVVPGDHVLAEQLAQAAAQAENRRRLVDHVLADAGQLGDERRDLAPWVDQ